MPSHVAPPDPDETRLSEDRDFLPGDRISNRYRIVSLLGRGGMGEVYRADDLKLRQPVALKFLPREVESRADLVDRLLTETRLARQVSHPNVCRVYDIGEWQGRHFLSMEYIDGEDLASLLKRIGTLPHQKALDVARQLCAGVDAAHQLGILHRDLKPANVMLDSKGRARITDFGLAVAADRVRGLEASSGTPAYMAPEQIEGREATVRSDIYALGVMLYELFTGHRDTSRPAEDLEPRVERVLLRCREADPVLRPRSAREVIAALPGGDPIAAALAAGDTPSPEIVAASGPDGSLSPATAFLTFGAIVLSLVVLVALSDRASSIGSVPMPRTADALEDHARAMLERLGYTDIPVDRASVIQVGNSGYRSYVEAHDTSPDRWKGLTEPGQLDALFGYRESRRYMVPLGVDGIVTDTDPSTEDGDVSVGLNLRGRLLWLIVQHEVMPPQRSPAVPPWRQLFAEAGLDMTRFSAAEPLRAPPVPFDTQAAWNGTLSDFGGLPVRVQSAALAGQAVYFELILPWDPYWNRTAAVSGSRTARFAPIVSGAVVTLVLGLSAVLVLRNLASGRVDRRGAFRVAAAASCLRLAVWITGGHHVPILADEWALFLTALGKSLVDGAAAWCLYVALEPEARRLHPRLLVSWTRLLHGRLTDSLVGRDTLFGVACAIVAILLLGQLYVLLPNALHLSSPPAPVPFPIGSFPYLRLFDGPTPRVLLGGRYILEAIALRALSIWPATLLIGIVLLASQMLFRRRSLAVAVTCLLLGLTTWPPQMSHYTAIGVACGIAGAVPLVLCTRFGLVGLAATSFSVAVWMTFPITARMQSPYFASGLAGVLMIAGLALYGAVVASWRRSRTQVSHAIPGTSR